MPVSGLDPFWFKPMTSSSNLLCEFKCLPLAYLKTKPVRAPPANSYSVLFDLIIPVLLLAQSDNLARVCKP